MNGSEAYKQKFLTDDALDAAISAYLAEPSKPVAVKVGTDNIDVIAVVLAHAYAVEVLAPVGWGVFCAYRTYGRAVGIESRP
jgi:hypothetical protein